MSDFRPPIGNAAKWVIGTRIVVLDDLEGVSDIE